MNKLKRLYVFIKYKGLRLTRFLGNKYYKKKYYKYFKLCGIDFPNGMPKYINYDVDFDLVAPEKIHIGKNTVIAKSCKCFERLLYENIYF